MIIFESLFNSTGFGCALWGICYPIIFYVSVAGCAVMFASLYIPNKGNKSRKRIFPFDNHFYYFFHVHFPIASKIDTIPRHISQVTHWIEPNVTLMWLFDLSHLSNKQRWLAIANIYLKLHFIYLDFNHLCLSLCFYYYFFFLFINPIWSGLLGTYFSIYRSLKIVHLCRSERKRKIKRRLNCRWPFNE